MLRQKMTANPNATQVELSAADVDSVRQALTQGSMTRPQLGQALMFALDQFSDPHLPAINRLISDLMDSGEVNIAPFLQNDYLERLGSERREMLLMSVERAGLRMDSNRPNARFIGFMLENLARPDAPDTVYTKAFIKQFLQDFYDVHSVDLTTPVGKILSQVLDLGGITTDAEKKLVFP